MDRRTLLRFLALNALALPYLLNAEQTPAKKAPFRRLVLIELNGGNDGLNMIIPYNDPRYYAMRPNIAVDRASVLPINDTLAFHPSLQALKPLYDVHELAIVQGVGYPHPNRSHFRSIDIWDTASSSDEYLEEGWINTLESLQPLQTRGVVLGGELGPLGGATSGVIKIDRLKSFLNQSKNLTARITYVNDNDALLHILETEAEINKSASLLRKFLVNAEPLPFPFQQSPFGNQLEIATKIIDSGLPIPVLKLRLGPFDTHMNQPQTHAKLLGELAEGIATLRKNLLASGQWNDTLVMTYSEFGRRVAENASRGTDHGTAAPHFLAGGAVKGGLYGTAPSLDDLDANGDLKFTTDFRALYHTVQKQWFRTGSERLEGFPLLPVL